MEVLWDSSLLRLLSQSALACEFCESPARLDVMLFAVWLSIHFSADSEVSGAAAGEVGIVSAASAPDPLCGALAGSTAGLFPLS